MPRPRDPDIEHRAVAAAHALLAEGGPSAVTMEAVAARAGVSKPALYRRWDNRAHLLFDLTTQASVPSPMPDLGSFRDDMLAAARILATSMASADRDALSAQFAAMIADRAFARRVSDEMIDRDMQVVLSIWDRAVERGEIAADLDGARVLEDVVGAFLYRIVILHRPVDDDMIVGTVDRLVRAVTARA